VKLQLEIGDLWHDTALHAACHSNDLKALGDMIASESFGSDQLNAVAAETGSWTALHVATFMNRLEATEMLVERGADLNLATADNGEVTALHLASGRGHRRIVDVLLKHPAIDVNAVDANGRTAVDYCAYYGRTSCLEALLLDPRTVTRLSSSNALCHAVARGHRGCARLMIGLGGDLPSSAFYSRLQIANGSNRRAILIAGENGFSDCLESLLASDLRDSSEAEAAPWPVIARKSQRTKGTKRVLETSTDLLYDEA